MITLFQAIQSLVPGAEVSVGIFDQSIEWHEPSVAPVTLEQIQQEQQRLQQAYDWNEYQRNRVREYPTIQEQLDALYHAGVFPPAMAARIRAVKAKYPRYSPDQTQTLEQSVPKMTVEEWLSEETKMTAEQWLAQQQSATRMTREEWLASQAEVKTEHNTAPKTASTVTRTIDAQKWLEEQTNQKNNQMIAQEKWLEEQKTQSQPRQQTREEWLAEQANVGN
jgi:hypothetical protein